MEPSRDEAKEIMDIREAAAYLGKGERWVYELVRKGKIPAARIGRSWLLKKSLIDAWLEEETRAQSQGRVGLAPDDL